MKSLFPRLAVLCAFGALVACAAEASPKKAKKQTPYDPTDTFGAYDDGDEEQAPIQVISEEDSGAYGPAPERPAKKDAGAGPTDDGGITKTYCTGALQAGDLAIVEIMITSRSGSGDDGEWVEIQNTRSCWLKVKGVVVDSPRGTAFNTATITDDLELAPKASFVVADSADAAKNHVTMGKVYTWDNTDVLKNDGDTINVKLGTTVIDTLTYPAFGNLEAGRSLAFPADCPADVRSNWARWSLAFNVYQGTYKGTPNVPNVDVTCF